MDTAGRIKILRLLNGYTQEADSGAARDISPFNCSLGIRKTSTFTGISLFAWLNWSESNLDIFLMAAR